MTVAILVTGQIGLFGWIFSQTRPRNMRTDITKGRPPAKLAAPTNSVPPPLLPLVPLIAAPAPTTPAAPVTLSRLLKIARIDHTDSATDRTLHIQDKAQVGERQLDPAAVSVSVQWFGAAGQAPVAQSLIVPAVWENFTSKQLTARFVGPPAQCAGYVVRTYYRKQLQDVSAVPPALAGTP